MKEKKIAKKKVAKKQLKKTKRKKKEIKKKYIEMTNEKSIDIFNEKEIDVDDDEEDVDEKRSLESMNAKKEIKILKKKLVETKLERLRLKKQLSKANT